MEQQAAEPGRFGSANTRSKTFVLWLIAGFILMQLVRQDLSKTGDKHLYTAFGTGSWAWTVFAVVVTGGLALGFATGTAVKRYYRYTGRTFLEDRHGFARSGGQDVASWSALAAPAAVIVLFAFVIPDEFLGPVRPFAVVVTSWVASAVLCRIAVSLLYRVEFRRPITITTPAAPPSRKAERAAVEELLDQISDPTGPRPRSALTLRCDRIYLSRRCRHRTFRKATVCYWHALRDIMALEDRRMPGYAVWTAYLSALGVIGAGSVLWSEEYRAEPVWYFAAASLLCWSMIMLADGRMAQLSESSQRLLWPKLLVGSLVTEAAVMVSVTFFLAITPTRALPVVHLVRTDADAERWGPVIVVAVAAFFLWPTLRFIRGRLLMGTSPGLSFVMGVAPLVAVGISLQTAVQSRGPLETTRLRDFWGAATGEHTDGVLLIAFLAAFVVAEITNVASRRARLGQSGFTATVWPSYAVCYLSPMLAMLMTRVVLVTAGMSGPVLFIAATVLFTLPFTWLGTAFLIRSY